jgi:hypothetical protein
MDEQAITDLLSEIRGMRKELKRCADTLVSLTDVVAKGMRGTPSMAPVVIPNVTKKEEPKTVEPPKDLNDVLGRMEKLF